MTSHTASVQAMLRPITPGLAYDQFGGPGGWEVFAEALGLRTIGVEWDDDTCATRRAAGLFTVQADVAQLVPERFAAVYGRPEGIIGSPPCPLFSSAGKGAGRIALATEHLRRGVAAAARGESDVQLARRRRQLRRDYADWLRDLPQWWKAPRRSGRAPIKGNESRPVRRGDRAREANRLAYEASLVWQPARWVARLRPRWVALEQVPPVLPLWEAMAHALEEQGYPCWVGVLTSERYGVAQTRKRAFLLASLDGAPCPPEPTHQEYVPGEPARAQEPDLFGPGLLPWVSMAEALGWGMNARPATTVPSVSEGGPRHDGGSGARELVRKAVERGEWEGPIPDHVASSIEQHEARNGAGLVVRQTSSTKGGTRPEGLTRSADEPARTIDSRADRLQVEDAGEVELVANEQPNATRRRADEPAPTIKGGHDTADRKWMLRASVSDEGADKARPRAPDEPAATVTGKHRSAEWQPDEPERVVLDRRQTGGDGTPVGPRAATDPAPTMTSEGLRGGRDVWRDREDPEATWTRDRPAPTITGSRKSSEGGLVGRQLAPGEGRNRGGHGQGDDEGADLEGVEWANGRPSTTVAVGGSGGRVFAPGHKRNGDDEAAGRDYPGRPEGAVRVSVAEAALLQSFPPGWPWRGTRTSQFQQVGNAVPPGLARPVLEAVMMPTNRNRLEATP